MITEVELMARVQNIDEIVTPRAMTDRKSQGFEINFSVNYCSFDICPFFETCINLSKEVFAE